MQRALKKTGPEMIEVGGERTKVTAQNVAGLLAEHREKICAMGVL